MKSIKKKKFQDFIKSEAEPVKYKVTGAFGLRNKGEIIKGYLVSVEGLTALLYFPYSRDECGCFEICEYDTKESVWISQKKKKKKNRTG